MKLLFIVNIGPVQSFIASARRTRDLHFGSWLLSDLAKAAAKFIEDNNGILIFPAPLEKQELESDPTLNVANKIVAVITTDKPETTGNAIYQAILARLQEITNAAFDGLGAEDFDRENALRQINDLIEYFCVAYPFDDTARSDAYEDTRVKVEALMAARKNTRNFQPVSWGSSQPKSSIDGQLENVVRKNGFRKCYAKPGEQLSGVDLLKRRGSRPETNSASAFQGITVLSTSHIATIPYLQRLAFLTEREKAQAREKWQTYIATLNEIATRQGQPIDIEEVPRNYRKHDVLEYSEGSLLFEERIVDMVDDTRGFEPAIQGLQNFYSYVDSILGRKRPDPYYVILHADGDRMGQVISKLAKESGGLERHRKLSLALDGFARGVSSIVEGKKYQGALIYAGGDDVLAFLPLHTALVCARELADTFARKLATFKDDTGNSPTLSVGLAIVHHLHPLSEALNIARAAETRAKAVPERNGVPGKNALAITVRKRSGGEYTVAEHWNTLDTRIAAFTSDFVHDAIPEGTAYELREMVLRLTKLVVSTKNAATLQKAIQADARRILQRKLRISQEMLVRQDNTAEEKARIEMYRRMLAIFDAETSPADQQESIPASERIEQMVNMLLVAQLFAEAKRIAEPQRKQSQEKSGVAQ